jgi:hypothetical protein
MAPMSIKVQFVVDESHRDMLSQIAGRTERSRGLVMRELIRAQYQMLIGGAPTCATGRPCSCPALVVPQPVPVLPSTAHGPATAAASGSNE